MHSPFYCPTCGRELLEPGREGVQQVRCPGCSKVVDLPQSMFATAASPPPPFGDGPAEPSSFDVVAAVVPSQGCVIEPEPLTPWEQTVYRVVEMIRNPKRSWGAAILMLLVSLGLFVAVGMKDDPLLSIGSLVLVLFLHEMGHYVGMRIFGYRDVRMFFIPFFGAAVSGRRTSAAAYKEAIVALLGPLPGLFLAAVLLVVLAVLRPDQATLTKAGHFIALLAVLNGFNLLPIFPLDGGRFLNIVLFSRNRFLEAAFQVLAAGALILLGAKGVGTIFMFLGIWMLFSLRGSFRVNTVAARLPKATRDDPAFSLNAPIPIASFRAILNEMKTTMPDVKLPGLQAKVLWNIWEKIHIQPPGAVATVALLLVYFGTLAALIGVPLLVWLAHAPG